MKETLKICYVILHYRTKEDTIRCVESIKERSRSSIVIVCNGSDNGSDHDIEELYHHDSQVITMMSNENIGFAKGNNLGISFAREKHLGDIIVCLNNDIVLISEDFEDTITKEYLLHHYAIAGVDIINHMGLHCNPWMDEFPTIENVSTTLKEYENGIKRCKELWGMPEIFHSILHRRKGRQKGRIRPFVTMHGSCLIFSPDFFEYYQGFCDQTFLFGEEIILAYQCYHKNLLLQLLNVKVLHNESSSTKTEYQSFIQRRSFYYKHIYYSTKVLLEMLIEDAKMEKN